MSREEVSQERTLTRLCSARPFSPAFVCKALCPAGCLLLMDSQSRRASSTQWQALHGAPVVWIKAYKPGRKSRHRVSHYVISQYVQDQSGYVNMCWSRKRSLGFPISKMWEEMRQQWSDRNAYRRLRGEIAIPRIVLYRTWEDLLAGHAIL